MPLIFSEIHMIPERDTLVFVSAISLPTLTKFEQASPKTDSDNAKISEKRYVDQSPAK